jgi:hypothetical protein
MIVLEPLHRSSCCCSIENDVFCCCGLVCQGLYTVDSVIWLIFGGFVVWSVGLSVGCLVVPSFLEAFAKLQKTYY